MPPRTFGAHFEAVRINSRATYRVIAGQLAGALPRRDNAIVPLWPLSSPAVNAQSSVAVPTGVVCTTQVGESNVPPVESCFRKPF